MHYNARSLQDYQEKYVSNMTTITEFLLLGFPDVFELQILQFVMFLLIYLLALIGNLLLILVVTLNCHLHTPMYLLLANLSILDICYISVTVPKAMDVSLTQVRSISFSGCMAQIFFGITFASAEMVLLTIMAYDRYIAICYPLRYHVIMGKMKCSIMVFGCWLGSIIYSALHTLNAVLLPFCGPNTIQQLFCDIPQVLQLACADTFGNKMTILICGIVFGLIFCSSVILSYIRIFVAVQNIPSSQGRYKAFSTCLPHLMVFSLFMITGLFTYLKKSSESSFKEILAALLYSIVSPVANPVIYSLRNKEIKKAIGRYLNKTNFMKGKPLTKKRGKEMRTNSPQPESAHES
ncbi:olfactory receptor 14A16-like [Varanus komodoensis]|uniref:olfactory receptor 14A16-like n=1 Tax=Varanus komodoensis TaxID=61221 RepID=UPI001CF7D45D|nr:olfactory receptor 14A16-like [Varanus komodoensis]